MEGQTQSPDFWKDHEKAVRISQKISELKEEIEKITSLKEDLSILRELEEADESLVDKLKNKIEKEEFRVLLSDKYDRNNALLEISAGAGGQDSQDWATMLLRMYQRYCQKSGWETEIWHESFGQAGGPEGRIGTKSVTMEIKGKYAYGFLKKESGVHRLVRLSPFSAKKLRHTSFAMVQVLPEIEESQTVQINPSDLKIETFRASGPGGQYVNKTESAIRITHLPTNIIVSCQTERLQGRNKEKALKLLSAKLQYAKEHKLQEELKEIKAAQIQSGRASPLQGGGKISAEFGSQIRSYVLHPYQLVKDVRTQAETSDTEGVLDGNLDEFIKAEIKL